VRAFYSVS